MGTQTDRKVCLSLFSFCGRLLCGSLIVVVQCWEGGGGSIHSFERAELEVGFGEISPQKEFGVILW